MDLPLGFSRLRFHDCNLEVRRRFLVDFTANDGGNVDACLLYFYTISMVMGIGIGYLLCCLK